MDRGKLVILFIFGLSLAMGAYAWWHHYQQGGRCLELWGSHAARLIRYASKVEAMQLTEDAGDGGQRLEVDGQVISVVCRKEITTTPGLVHARQALIEDASFVWGGSDEQVQSAWRFALQFTEGPDTVTLLFDRASDRVRLLKPQREGILTARLADAYRSRFPIWLDLDDVDNAND